jgi:DNA-directed RNA polymerase subunit M/transcription elongation factor TFIIS
MKNPFEKEDNSLVIAAVAIGAIAAGAIAYLYTTRYGSIFRNKVNEKVEENKEHATDYLAKKSHQLKKKKTDLHEIQEIIGG